MTIQDYPNKKYTEMMYRFAIYSLAVAIFFINISVSVCDIFYLMAVLFLVLAGNYRQTFRDIFARQVTWWLLALAAFYIVGMFYSVAPMHDVLHDLYKHYWIIATVLLIPLFRSSKDQDFIMLSFLIGMAFVMFLSYLEYIEMLTKHINVIRYFHLKHIDYSAVFRTHIQQGFFLAFASGLWLYQFYNRFGKWRWINFALFVLASINVVFISSGRTGYLTYIVVMCIVNGYHFGFKRLPLIAFIFTLLVGMALLLPTGASKRLHESIHNFYLYKMGETENTDGLRVAMFFNGIKLIKQRPLFGYGTGGFGTAYSRLSPEEIHASGMQRWSSENTYINFTVQFGLIGLLFLSAFMIYLWRCSYSMDVKHRIIFQAFLLAFLFGGLTTAFFTSSFSKHMLSLMIAACCSRIRMRRNIKSFSNVVEVSSLS